MGKVKLELQNKQLRMPKIMTRFFSFRYKKEGHRLSMHDIKSSSNSKKKHVSGQLEIRTK